MQASNCVTPEAARLHRQHVASLNARVDAELSASKPTKKTQYTKLEQPSEPWYVTLKPFGIRWSPRG